MKELFWCYFTLVGVLGLCVGSFLNVVIYRVPNKMSLSRPASHCPTCNYSLKWYDNIPLLSYIILRGKCRNCKGKISLRYPLVEFLNMALWLVSFALFFKENLALALLAPPIISTLLCVAFIDYDCQIIPDRFQIILLVLIIPLFFLDKSVTLTSRFLGCGITLLFLILIYLFFYLLRKREGIGFGDIKLLTICGGLLGVWKMFLGLLISSILASVILLILMKKNKDKGTHEYPFAPFLVFGIIFTLLFGDPIIAFYLSLF